MWERVEIMVCCKGNAIRGIHRELETHSVWYCDEGFWERIIMGIELRIINPRIELYTNPTQFGTEKLTFGDLGWAGDTIELWGSKLILFSTISIGRNDIAPMVKKKQFLPKGIIILPQMNGFRGNIWRSAKVPHSIAIMDTDSQWEAWKNCNLNYECVGGVGSAKRSIWGRKVIECDLDIFVLNGKQFWLQGFFIHKAPKIASMSSFPSQTVTIVMPIISLFRAMLSMVDTLKPEEIDLINPPFARNIFCDFFWYCSLVLVWICSSIHYGNYLQADWTISAFCTIYAPLVESLFLHNSLWFDSSDSKLDLRFIIDIINSAQLILLCSPVTMS